MSPTATLDSAFKTRLQTLHRLRWSATWVWLGFLAAFLCVQALTFTLLLGGMTETWQWAALILLVLLTSHIMHTHLIAFHEAAHGLLCPVPWINDGLGRLLGTLSFMSFELYRAAHHTHHAYLATERDEELWPFVKPASPRWFRCLMAWLELSCGLLFTPSLFLRAFLRRGTVITNPSLRRRVWLDLAGIVVFWTPAVFAVAWWDLWMYWLPTFLVPGWIAGMLQSFRKYVEHMGVKGSTPLSATRSVQPTGWTGQIVSFTLLHEPFHGLHHKYPRLPHEVLPEMPSALLPERPGDMAPFHSYRAALWDMLPSLRDPRVGKQWQEAAADGSG